MTFPTSYFLGAVLPSFLPRLFSGVLQATGLLPRGLGGGSPQKIFQGSGTTAHACLSSTNAPHLIYTRTHNDFSTTNSQTPLLHTHSQKYFAPNTFDDTTLIFHFVSLELNSSFNEISFPCTDRAERNDQSWVRLAKKRFEKNVSYGKKDRVRKEIVITTGGKKWMPC